MPVELGSYELVRFLLQRGLALVYLIAFAVALRQGRALIGENGLQPFTAVIEDRSFREAPSVFHLFPSDRALQAAAWLGVLLSVLAATGVSDLFGTPFSILIWFLLWILYLSFVNVGRIFYAYGWESLLLEAGFLAIFLGAAGTQTPDVVIWFYRWLLFRVMFGAGLIKLRGDQCWHDLTCMEYHYETQPMPNPLSWLFHHAPRWFHKLETAGNHVVELVVPFFYFAPQPFAAIAGAITILFQGWLMLSGNFSWLNALTALLAVATFSDPLLSFIPIDLPAAAPLHPVHAAAVAVLTLLVLVLSYRPVRNLISPRQRMNTSFDPLHLVNTYGAFGSITKTRYQLVVEGTSVDDPDEGDWEEYTFKGQPVKLDRMPPQWAPYHLRLDWQLWFAAMTPRPTFRSAWLPVLVEKLLEDDAGTLKLVRHNPFPDEPPQQIRVQRHVYEFTSPEERKETGNWWSRELVGTYYGPVSR